MSVLLRRGVLSASAKRGKATLGDTGANITDVLAKGAGSRSLLDTLVFAPASIALSLKRVLASQGVTVTESVVPSSRRSKSLSDTGASISDLLAKAKRAQPTDSLSIATSSSVLRKITRGLVDAGVNFSDSVNMSSTAAVSGPAPKGTIYYQAGNPDIGAVESGLAGGGGGGGTQNFGKTTAGGTQGTGFSADRKRVNKVTVSSAITATSMSTYVGPIVGSGTEALRLVIYRDSGGAPGALVGVTSERVLNAASNPSGWYTFNFPTGVALTAGTYWIGIWTGATAGIYDYFYDTVTSARNYNNNTYSSSANPSDPFGAVTIDNDQFSIYVTGS